MSTRHYLTVEEVTKDSVREVYQEQILGNNEWFNEENAYERLGIELGEDGEADKTEIDFKTLLCVWLEDVQKNPDFNYIVNIETNIEKWLDNIRLASWNKLLNVIITGDKLFKYDFKNRFGDKTTEYKFYLEIF